MLKSLLVALFVFPLAATTATDISAIEIMLCTKVRPCGKFPALEIRTSPVRAADVATIDGMMKAFYEVVSGPKAQPRGWGRDRTLYTPDLRFISVSERRTGKLAALIMDHQTFAESSQPGLAKRGFYEKEIHRNVQQFGHIAHVFSTYESRETPDGPATARGINSIEMLFDGHRWWITFAEWDEERPGQTLPKEFLP
jgi:hypothetical protein